MLFSVTAVVLRLMGKRQLAQLQPYEVVITLMISDLATLPMADVEIPLLSGVVSILTRFWCTACSARFHMRA